MTFMPFASVVARTWSAPGTRADGAGFVSAATALLATPSNSNRQARVIDWNLGMQHLGNAGAQL